MAEIRWFRRQDCSRVLGRGSRAVLWVQGCPLACPACLVPESWPDRGGRVSTAQELAEWVLGLGVEGLTLSGGEPMRQAQALLELVDRVRQVRDLGVVCYTGYRREQLGSPGARALLARVDLLIDGPYRQELHGDLLWRGSRNQRLLDLSGRYRAQLPPRVKDRSAGLEFELGRGTFSMTGVPPEVDLLGSLPRGPLA